MKVRTFYSPLSPNGSSFLPDSIRLSDIRVLYPSFDSVFEKHVKDAKFGGIPSKAPDFKALKLGVITLWDLQREHKRMRPETRSALIQALVVERDFQQAFQVIQNRSNFITRWFSSLRSDPRGAVSFKNGMKIKASQLSDSEFLQQLESTDEEDLRSAAQLAKALGQTELMSSIDGMVKKLTHVVLVMQQEVCGREVQLQVYQEEREVLNNALVEFIREINKKSALEQKP